MENNKKDNILYIIFAFLGTLSALFLNIFPILFWGIFLFFLILLCLSLGTFGIFIIIAMIITVIISAVYIFGGKQPPFFYSLLSSYLISASCISSSALVCQYSSSYRLQDISVSQLIFKLLLYSFEKFNASRISVTVSSSCIISGLLSSFLPLVLPFPLSRNSLYRLLNPSLRSKNPQFYSKLLYNQFL